MEEDDLANMGSSGDTEIDFQNIIYYAAPKATSASGKIDPELEATFDKLGIPLHERNMLAEWQWMRYLTPFQSRPLLRRPLRRKESYSVPFRKR